MSDELEYARSIARITENLAGSPDDRSVPYLLGGILNALIAIADQMPTDGSA